MKKVTFIKIMLLLAVLLSFIFVGCSKPAEPTNSAKPATESSTSSAAEQPATSTTEQPATSTTAQPAEKTFTMDEIAKFDGQNGNPAYVVVSGTVYDVTNVRAWPNGIHQGKYKAGQDVTDLLMNKSPHGAKVLEKLPIVGKIK